MVKYAILMYANIIDRLSRGIHMGKLIGKLKDSNKNTIITIAMFTSFAVGIIILVIGMTIYKYRIAKLGFADSFDNQEYQYHYVVISEQLDEPFWDFIY